MKIQPNIRNIIFDLGGVLCGLSSERCIAALHQIGADAIAFYVEEHRVEDLFLQAELGKISTREFCDEVRRISGKDLSDESIVWAWNELLTGISHERRARLLSLSRRYRLFILSNTNDMHWQKCAREFFPYCPAPDTPEEDCRMYGVDDYFDKVFLSYQLQLAKPSEEIFHRVLTDAGLEASETLFIDDSKVNCEAAGRLGIQTFHNEHIDDWLAWT